MHRFKFGLATLIAALFIFWTLHRSSLDLWQAISPAYIADAERELAHTNSQTKSIAFCFSLLRDGRISTSESCKSFLIQHPQPYACAVQNLSEGKWDNDVLRADPVRAAAAIREIVGPFGCQTILLDFESLQKSDRERFSQWVKIASAELQAHGLRFAVAVHAKVDDAGTWEGPAAQNWKELCANSDELLLMAYDFHFPGTTAPGEQAPLDWVEKVLRYAKSTCPTSHLRLGLAAYGYKWPQNIVITEHEANFAPGAMPMAPDFVETSSARRLKFELARSLGVTKFFIWAQGMTADQ